MGPIGLNTHVPQVPLTATDEVTPARTQFGRTDPAADSFLLNSAKAIKSVASVGAFPLILFAGLTGCSDASSQGNCPAPDIQAPYPDYPLLSAGMETYLRELTQSLPADLCQAVRRIAFIPERDLETLRGPVPESVAADQDELDDAFQDLQLGHLIPNRNAFYHAPDQTIYLSESMLFHRSSRVPNRREIASAVLMGYGQAFRNRERVEILIDELTPDALEPFLGLAIDEDRLYEQVYNLFPEIITHYVLSGHTIREAARQKDTLAREGKSAADPRVNASLSKLDYLFEAYKVVRERYFDDRLEYQLADEYETLAQGDVGMIRAVLTGDSKSVNAPYLNPYRKVATVDSPSDLSAFAFAGGYLLDRMLSTLPPPDSGMVQMVRTQLEVEPDDTEVNIAMLMATSGDPLRKLTAGIPVSDPSSLWELLEILASTRKTQYRPISANPPVEPMYWPAQIDNLVSGFLTGDEHVQGALTLYLEQPSLRDYFLPLIRSAKEVCDRSHEALLATASESEILDACATRIEAACQEFPELCRDN